MLTERSIINFLIWTAGLIAAPYLATTAIYGNYTPAMSVLGLAFVIAVFGFLKDGMCVLPLVGYFCSGRFTFLPVKLNLGQLALVAMIGYYVISYLALRRKLMRAGPWLLTIPILVIAAIIMSDEPNLGVRIMGGGREGGTGSIVIILSAIGYLCGISMNSPSPRFLSLVPVFATIATFIGAIPYIATTYAPGSAPIFYMFSEDINTSAYSADVMNSGGMVRNSMQGQLGLAILTCLMAYYPFTSWLHPKRFWMCLVALVCSALSLSAGFRGTAVTFALEVMFLSAAYIRWRSILILPALAFAALLLSVAHSDHFIELPLAAQRTLDFIPGDWDSEVVQNTDASNDFRKQIIDIYMREYAAAHPWFGNGLSYSSAEFDTYNSLALSDPTPDGYWQFKVFIVGKMFHTGWVGMYDALGIIGSIFFVGLFSILSYLTGRSVWGPSADQKSGLFPVKAWLFATTMTNFITYFTVFGAPGITVPFLCYTAIAWYHVNRVETLGSEKVRRREMRFDPARAGLPISASA